MAKKYLLVLVLAALAAGSAFAQIGLSAGIGGKFSANFDSYKYSGTVEEKMKVIGGGFFGFFDATYVEANIGLMFGGLKYGDGDVWDDERITGSYLNLGLFGKYPFDLGRFSLFPMLGIQFDIGLSAKYDGKDIFGPDEKKSDNMNRFWIKFGVGADFNLTEKLYLRPSFLYGINFGSKVDREFKDSDSNLSSFHHGLDIRAALGFRF